MAQVCTSCGATVTPEELAQGLAVRIDGKPVCPMCIDALPGEAVVRINQLRALRGLASTTYVTTLPRHPEFRVFTFTTAPNLVVHRRSLAATGTFIAPPLPPPGQRKNLVRARGAPPPPPPNPWPMIAVVAGGVLLVGALAAWLIGSGGGRSAPQPSPEPPPAARPEPAAPVVKRTRIDYPADPFAAWSSATADRACPPELRQAIGTEVAQAQWRQLAAIEADLDAGRLDQAERGLAAWRQHRDVASPDIAGRATEFASRLREAREALARQHRQQEPVQKPPPPLPEPTPAAPATRAPEPLPVAPAPEPPVIPAQPATRPVPVPVPAPPDKDPIAAPLPPAAGAPAIAPWDSLTLIGTERRRMDAEATTILAPWPVGFCPPLIGDRGQMLIPLRQPISQGASGLVFVMHPGQSDRLAIAASITMPGANAPVVLRKLPPLELAGGEWQPVAVTLPADLGPGATRAMLKLESPTRKTFAMARAVTVSGRAPEIADAGPLAAALYRSDAIKPQTALLKLAGQFRGSGKRALELDPTNAKVLLCDPGKGFTEDEKAVEAGLRDFRGAHRAGANHAVRLPANALELKPMGGDEVHFVVIALNGDEDNPASGWNGERVWSYLSALKQISGGCAPIPVIALGSLKAPRGGEAPADSPAGRLRDHCLRLGFPLIDLGRRPEGRHGDYPRCREEAMAMVTTALRNLAWDIERQLPGRR